MLNIRVEIQGDKKVIAQLGKMLKEFDNWKPELEATGDYLVAFYRDPVYETEGGIIGERWQPLNPSYARRKAVKYPGRGILEASGTMRGSYQTRVYSKLLELINPTEYAVYHQEGRGVPERVLIKVDDERKNQIIDIFKKGALIKVQNALRAS